MANRAFALKFSGKVDKAAGIIHGVSVITEGIAAGWEEHVDALTLSQVMACAREYAGGLKVVDRHTRGTDSIFSTAGALKNFTLDGKQLRADLHILATEPNREKLLEMAETMPDTFGISIAFSGPSEERDGKKFARCTEIYNAALVDVPAANPTGLFSARFEDGTGAKVDAPQKCNSATMTPDEIKTQVTAAIATATTELSARLKTAEDKIATLTTELAASGKTVTELSAKLETSTKELSAKIVSDEKRLELTAQTVAKEFAKHTGQGAGVRTDGAGTGAGDGKSDTVKAGEAFIATAVKHYATTKSKAKALELAIAEDAKGYSAYRAANLDIKWAA